MNMLFMFVTLVVSNVSGWLKEVAWKCGVGRGATSAAEERRATLLALADEHAVHVRDERDVPGADVDVEGGGVAVRSRGRSGKRAEEARNAPRFGR